MKKKTVVTIEKSIYSVGYPECQGCENLCFPAPLTCVFDGDGCEYPDSRKKASGPIGTIKIPQAEETK
jgi:hypothetical protein